MAERRELVETYTLLHENVESSELQANRMSDLELLRLIIEIVKSRRISQQVGDSLAFPNDIRSTFDLRTSNELWNELDKFNDVLRQDYTCRRQMLLSRLDCTVESFKWTSTTSSRPDKVRHEPRDGAAGQSTNDKIHQLYEKARMTFKEEPNISIVNVLATRDKDCDTLLNGVVSSKSVDCKINYGNKEQTAGSQQVNLKQVIIPNVPDRGGRTDEIRPPAGESFGQRGGFRRGRGRHK